MYFEYLFMQILQLMFKITKYLLENMYKLYAVKTLFIWLSLTGKYHNFVYTKDCYKKVTASSPMFALDCEMV